MHVAIDDVEHATVRDDDNRFAGMCGRQAGDASQDALLVLPPALAAGRSVVGITTDDRGGIVGVARA